MRIRFEVGACPETGGYLARWDDPKSGGITTQGDTFAELDAMVRDAVVGYFADRPKPREILLHFNVKSAVKEGAKTRKRLPIGSDGLMDRNPGARPANEVEVGPVRL